MRVGEFERKTGETQVSVNVKLDGEGRCKVDSGIRFLDHMLTSLAVHSMIDIEAKVEGDLRHHVVEDLAICLGRALDKALGDRSGLTRFGYALVPMDSSLAEAALDLAKRPYWVIDLKIEGTSIEDMLREDILHFLQSLASSMEANIHVSTRYGQNDHHKVEACFKALALALRQAASPNLRRRGPPSSKGMM